MADPDKRSPQLIDERIASGLISRLTGSGGFKREVKTKSMLSNCGCGKFEMAWPVRHCKTFR